MRYPDACRSAQVISLGADHLLRNGLPAIGPFLTTSLLVPTSISLIYQGLDPKSIMINLATIFLFLLPFLAYFDRENGMKYCQYVAGSMVLAFLVPPIGWMRPHPYTDKPGNEPIGYKAQ